MSDVVSILQTASREADGVRNNGPNGQHAKPTRD